MEAEYDRLVPDYEEFSPRRDWGEGAGPSPSTAAERRAKAQREASAMDQRSSTAPQV